jgi:hypothetical protein
MSKAGFLIKHSHKETARVLYYTFSEGLLSCSVVPGGKCLEEFRLTGCRVTIKAQKRKDGIAHSFYISVQTVQVRDLSYALGKRHVLELSAPSAEERQSWGKVLQSWHRHYFRGPDELKCRAAQDDLERNILLEAVETARGWRESSPLYSRLPEMIRRSSCPKSATSNIHPAEEKAQKRNQSFVESALNFAMGGKNNVKSSAESTRMTSVA